LLSKGLILSWFFFALAANAAAPAGVEAFNEGMKEFAAKDWDKALDLLETALLGDPDNLQFGSEYRRVAILRAQAMHGNEGKPEDFDRPIKFFERLVASNPSAPNANLNYGLAYVDKLPCLDALTRITAANTALSQFTKSLELRPAWITYYTRGTSYLFWPKFFNRAKLGVADLETVLKMQSAGPKRAYQAHTWVALGDGYWKMNDLEKARSTWTDGLKEFPDTPALKDRLAKQGDDLAALIQDALDPRKRVNTDLKEMWLNP
jgi:tetratricopeptide (TPR) repeat protein